MWMSMVILGEFKKAVMLYFKLKSQAEKNRDKLKIGCVLIEIRFRQVYCTNTIKCVTAETTCLLAVLWLPPESGRLK
jgi:hypothetical protein